MVIEEFRKNMITASSEVDWEFVEKVNKVALDSYAYLYKDWGDSHLFILVEELSELAVAHELGDRDCVLEEIADVVIIMLGVRYVLELSIRDVVIPIRNDLNVVCTLLQAQKVILKYERRLADIQSVKNSLIEVLSTIKCIIEEYKISDTEIYKAINVKNNRNARKNNLLI